VKIKRVELRGVLSHADSSIDFPDRGVVLVTGANGAGKSAIYEGIAFALFGETLRGEKPWTDPPIPEVRPSIRVLLVDGLDVVKKPRALTFSGGPAGDAVAYETPGKAAAALRDLVGDFDAWRMTSVFSPADMAAFTLASDTGRKEILESILGLSRFDAAGRSANEDLREAEAAIARVENLRAVADAKRSSMLAVVDRDPPRPSDLVRAELHEAHARYDALRAAVTAEQEKYYALNSTVAETHAAADVARADLARAHQAIEAARGGLACRTCGRDMPPGSPYCGDPIDALDERLTFLLDAEKNARERVFVSTLAVDNLRADMGAAHLQYGQLQMELKASLAHEQARAAVQSSIDLLVEEIEELDALIAMKKNAREVIACAIKALRSVRGLLLASALDALQALVASYLDQIGDAYTVRIAADELGRVSLSIARAGSGRSYRSASQGERRRVDLAVLLALGDLAAAARGTAPGLLVLDECLDSLDTAGRASVLRLVEQIAADRPVVVITHATEVATGIECVASYEVRDGAIHKS